ncbi:MAG TPA: glucosamine-6-phosphate deaminase [Isosphaeraceae bacterium]|jgi:glucosamine-6-phosphate deaminase|nr:glucosamine-6-phosphate deaminase [Isosphaeraceae bacterium]
MPAPVRELELAGASVQVFPDALTACRAAADTIADLLQAAIVHKGHAVVGLATGATPLAVYARLVARHQAGELSFARVSTYNLDEFYPISPLDPNSYRIYMQRHLFGHVDLPPNQTHVFDGTVPEAFVAEHAAQYDRWIAAEGGLDLQLLGIGRNGHIGFNEPTDMPVEVALSLPTRVVPLHPITLVDAARDFGGDQTLVPRRAFTEGVAPILAARSILMLATGSVKAEPVSRALTGPMTAQLPATLLQAAGHRVTWMLDEAAARNLS